MKIIAVSGWAMLSLLLLISCTMHETGTVRPATSGIEDVEWFVVEVGGIPVSPSAGERRPFLNLDATKKEAMGFAGCNNFFGSYELDGSSMKFGPVAATRMACPDLQMSLETEVFKALDKTRAWKISEDVLLFLDDGNVLARFAMAQEDEQISNAEPKITGADWQWEQTVYNDDRKVVPADSKDYTVRFMEDDTVSVKADCNQKGGTYSSSAEDRRLSIEITHSTMAACPEGSLEDEFVRGLTAAAIYFMKDGDLFIDLKYDSGTMKFSKQKKEVRP